MTRSRNPSLRRQSKVTVCAIVMAETSRVFVRTALLMLFFPLIAGCESEVTTVDIRTLATRSANHDALACPVGLCRIPADYESPDFAVTVEELMTKIQALIEEEPRTKLVQENDTLNQLVFVQRSRFFRFPDTVRIQAVKRGSGSSIIIYSRSNYGASDLGVNKKRVDEWLTKLTKNIETLAT